MWVPDSAGEGTEEGAGDRCFQFSSFSPVSLAAVVYQ